MEKERPLSPSCGLPGPYKKTLNDKKNIVYDKLAHSGSYSKKNDGVGPKSDEHNTPLKQDTILRDKTPYTEKFFNSLAKTILDTFPLKDFARGNHCEVEDVVLAIREVVVKPLSKPFKLQKSHKSPIAQQAKTSTKSTQTSLPAKKEASTGKSHPAGIPDVKLQKTSGFSTIERNRLTSQTTESFKYNTVPGNTMKAKLTNANPTETGFSSFKTPSSSPDGVRHRSSVSADKSPVKQDVFSKYVTMRSRKDGNYRILAPGK